MTEYGDAGFCKDNGNGKNNSNSEYGDLSTAHDMKPSCFGRDDSVLGLKENKQRQRQQRGLWLKGSSGVLVRAWWQVLRLRCAPLRMTRFADLGFCKNE